MKRADKQNNDNINKRVKQKEEEKRKEKKRKYILIIGGSLSGIGKGTLTASIGVLLKEEGKDVGVVKLEPYLNEDSSSMDSGQNGEVFVTEDGAQVGNDIGNYERLLAQPLHANSYLTTGQLYKGILDKERRGDYLGHTV